MTCPLCSYDRLACRVFCIIIIISWTAETVENIMPPCLLPIEEIEAWWYKDKARFFRTRVAKQSPLLVIREAETPDRKAKVVTCCRESLCNKTRCLIHPYSGLINLQRHLAWCLYPLGFLPACSTAKTEEFRQVRPRNYYFRSD